MVRAARLQQRELPPKTPRRVGGLDERAARVAPPLCDAQQPLPRAVRRACPSLASRLVKRSACARTFPARMVTRSCRRKPWSPQRCIAAHNTKRPNRRALGRTSDYVRAGRDYDQKHDRPKELWGNRSPRHTGSPDRARGHDAPGDRGGLERTRPRATASQWPRRRAGSNSSRSCPICAPRPAAVQRVLGAQPERHRARSDPR